MEYSYEYSGLKDRQVKVKEAETKGYVMLHDNFSPGWKQMEEPRGTLIFTDSPSISEPPKPSIIEQRIINLEKRVHALEIKTTT